MCFDYIHCINTHTHTFPARWSHAQYRQVCTYTLCECISPFPYSYFHSSILPFFHTHTRVLYILTIIPCVQALFRVPDQRPRTALQHDNLPGHQTVCNGESLGVATFASVLYLCTRSCIVDLLRAPHKIQRRMSHLWGGLRYGLEHTPYS